MVSRDPYLPVQGQLVDDEPRGHVARGQPALAFHAGRQPGADRLGGDAGIGRQQRAGVVLGLQQPVHDAR